MSAYKHTVSHMDKTTHHVISSIDLTRGLNTRSLTAAEYGSSMNSYRIPSIANTCSIFQLLTATRKVMSASDIAKELDLPRTSVFRILKTLEEFWQFTLSLAAYA